MEKMDHAEGPQVRVMFTNMERSAALDEYIEKKIATLDKLLTDKDRNGIFDVDVGRVTNHHQTGDVYKAELMFTAGSKNFRAEALKGDVYAALDEAKDEMSKEIRRNKGRRLDRIRKGGAKIKRILKGLYRGEAR